MVGWGGGGGGGGGGGVYRNIFQKGRTIGPGTQQSKSPWAALWPWKKMGG